MDIKKFLFLAGIVLVLFFCYQCPFAYFLGISCPGCGMTRALLSLLRLDFAEALHAHPLCLLVVVFAILYGLDYAGICRFSAKVKQAALVFACLLFAAVYVLRLAGGSDIVYVQPESGLIWRTVTKLRTLI